MAGDRRRSRAGGLVIAGSAGWMLASGLPARAQEAAEERSQSFQAVQGAVKEDVAGGPLLLIAYGVVWLVLLLYLVRLVRQQKRAEADVARLEQVLTKAERPG